MNKDKFLSAFSLGRGAGVMDCAMKKSMSSNDLISIVASYLGTGKNIDDITRNLSSVLQIEDAIHARTIFDIHQRGRNALWAQGPAWDDIQFVNKELIKKLGQTPAGLKEAEYWNNFINH